LTLAEFQGDRFVRLNRLNALLEQRALDEELRWHESRAATA
jgi:hypothetical protein